MAEQLSTVRIAKEADIPGIYELCKLLHEENGIATMDDEKVLGMIWQAVTRQGAVIGVIDGEQGLEGCISLVVDELWYTTQHHISELFNFVRPDARKSPHAKSLIEFAKSFADSVGLPLFIGVVSNERTEAKVRLYQRQLSKPAGAFFIHGRFAEVA